MPDKRSEQNKVLLRLDELSYFLIDLAVPYWKKYAEGNDKSRQGMIRKAATAFAIQILKGEGVYDKAVENFRLESAGAEILKEKERVTTTSEDELP